MSTASATCGLVLASLLISACSSAASIDFAELAAAVQRAKCERLVRCALIPDEESCLAYFRAADDPSLGEAIKTGKVRYDAERASACVAKLAAQSCDLTLGDARNVPRACTEAFAGQVEGGQPCAFDGECVSGTCDQPGGCPESGCCEGTCHPAQPPDGAGDACLKDRDCERDLVCTRGKTCQPLAGEGGDCGADRECQDGLACINPLATMPGTCRPLPHLGEACPYLRCAEEQLRCGDDGTCVALGLVDAPCASGADCSPYLECDATSHLCRQIPSLGMSCTGSCLGESYCRLESGGAGTCVAPLENGALCEFNADCASFYCFVVPVYSSCSDPPACF